MAFLRKLYLMAVFGMEATTMGIFASLGLFRYYQRAFMGPAKRPAIATLPDLRPRELVVAGSLTFLVLIFGFFPGPLPNVSSGSVEMLTQRLEAGPTPATPTAAAPGGEEAP